MGDNSHLLSIRDDNCSNASTCGSERSALQLTSCSSSEARSSNLDINQIVDENENIEDSPSTGEVRQLWGEIPRGETTEQNEGILNTSGLGDNRPPSEHSDHTYLRGNISTDPDLMTWYCLGTC
ncbi:hypothetical protein ACF0H5_020358 [Mactra antiquata]